MLHYRNVERFGIFIEQIVRNKFGSTFLLDEPRIYLQTLCAYTRQKYIGFIASFQNLLFAETSNDNCIMLGK